MAAKNPQATGLLVTIIKNAASILIIISTFAAILILLTWVASNYHSVADAASILGIVIPTVGTVAAAAFGISVGSNIGNQAGQQAGQATAIATKQQTAQVKEAVRPLLQDTKNNAHSMHEGIQKLQSQRFVLDHPNRDLIMEPLNVHKEKLNKIQAHIERIQATLDMLPI